MCCCQVHVQAASLLKRNKHWNAFRVWLYHKQLGLLKGNIPLTEILQICQIFFIFILCDQRGDALTQILPFEAKWDEQKSI